MEYWYFTTHGVQIGSVPKKSPILELVDTPNGTYFKTDRVFSTEELNYYDIRESAPSEEILRRFAPDREEDVRKDKDVHTQKKYYEIELDHDARARELDDTDELVGECSICIVGERKPTIEEAEDFCKEEMKNAGFEYVIAIREIDKEEARFYFDEEREKELPVFGKTEDSFLQESEIERE